MTIDGDAIDLFHHPRTDAGLRPVGDTVDPDVVARIAAAADDPSPDAAVLGNVIAAPPHTVDPVDALREAIGRPSWQRDAACRGVGPAPFYDPDPALRQAAAERYCATCAVADRCAGAGADEPEGRWGEVDRGGTGPAVCTECRGPIVRAFKRGKPPTVCSPECRRARERRYDAERRRRGAA